MKNLSKISSLELYFENERRRSLLGQNKHMDDILFGKWKGNE
jgi:hypothetical protein